MARSILYDLEESSKAEIPWTFSVYQRGMFANHKTRVFCSFPFSRNSPRASITKLNIKSVHISLILKCKSP